MKGKQAKKKASLIFPFFLFLSLSLTCSTLDLTLHILIDRCNSLVDPEGHPLKAPFPFLFKVNISLNIRDLIHIPPNQREYIQLPPYQIGLRCDSLFISALMPLIWCNFVADV